MDIDRSSGVKWPAVTNTSLRNNGFNGCILTGLGRDMARDYHRRSVAARGGTISHKPTRAKGSLLSTLGSLQVTHPVPSTCSSTNGQHCTAVAYVNKRGGTRSHSLSLLATDFCAFSIVPVSEKCDNPKMTRY